MKQAAWHELLTDQHLDLVSEIRTQQVSLFFQILTKLGLVDLPGESVKHRINAAREPPFEFGRVFDREFFGRSEELRIKTRAQGSLKFCGQADACAIYKCVADIRRAAHNHEWQGLFESPRVF
ncbi:hypothetical protein ACW9IO_25820 [Pseudomonas azotoformans]